MITPGSQPIPTTALTTLVRLSARAVPVVRYTTGVVGLIAGAMLATRVAPGPLATVIGGVAMFAGVVLLVILARLARTRDHMLRASLAHPALALAWTVVLATAVVLALMITITFWSTPTSWRDLRESAQGCTPVANEPF